MKKDINFNFDDISGNIKEKKLPVKEKKTGITIITSYNDALYTQDISECTKEQFVTWCDRIFPGYSTFTVKKGLDFNKTRDRVKAFEDIVMYSSIELFSKMKRKERTTL